MRIVSEHEVKEILRNREQKIQSIHNKMIRLYKELEDNDTLLSSIVLPAVSNEGMPGGGGTHKDLGDVLTQYYQRLAERNKELKKLMWYLSEDEDCINRIWNCFYALGEPYFTILNELYVENQLYQAVEAQFDMSHKTFEKHRKFGIDMIIKLYESGNSVTELMRKNQSQKVVVKRRTVDKEQAYCQMSLEDLLPVEENN